MNRIVFYNTILAILFAAGCSRSVEGKSKIRLEAPSSSLGAMAALPAGQKACYGVSIKGGSINGSPGNSCSPDVGMIAGYVAAGGTLELDVPKGSGYTIDLYLYLMDGSTGACPVFTRSFSASDLNHVYHVGVATDINLTQSEEEVTITSFFPGVGSTIASGFTPSCSASANNPGFRINSGAGFVSNGTYKLQGRIQDGQKLSNGSYKFIMNK